VNFDLKISSEWVKFCHIKIVQLAVGDLHLVFEAWNTTAARSAPSTRTNFIRKPFTREPTIAAAKGGEYSEILAGQPMHYHDMDAVTPDDSQHYIHCRLENQGDGTASDFDVSLIVAEPYEASH
jgi:hypothetical protein